jgi:pimeloyl-ACP methyl ester carboxylesterase
MLLHGFNQTCWSWAEFAQAAAATNLYDIVAFDQRGHGDTHRAPDGDYSPATMVADVDLVREHFGFEKIVLVGFSMGAGISSLYASQHPERVTKLVLVDYAPRVEESGVDQLIKQVSHTFPSFDNAIDVMCQFNRRRTRENIADRLSHSLYCDESSSPPVWRFKVDPAFLKRLRERTESQQQQQQEQETDTAATARAATSPTIHSDAAWQALARISVPTLLVRGRNSELLTEANARRLVCVCVIACARLMLIGARHL